MAEEFFQNFMNASAQQHGELLRQQNEAIQALLAVHREHWEQIMSRLNPGGNTPATSSHAARIVRANVKLPQFKGDPSDPEDMNVEAFLIHITDIADAQGDLNEKGKVLLASSCFEGVAKAWWERRRQELENEGSFEVYTFGMMKEEMSARFKRPNQELQVRKELRELKQKAGEQGLSNYINKFCNLAFQLKQPTQTELVSLFTAGLLPQTCKHVWAFPDASQTTLDVTIQRAQQFDSARTASLPQHNPHHMELDAINMWGRGRAYGRGRGRGCGWRGGYGRGRGEGGRRGGRGGEPFAGECYECNVKGHMRRDCPKLKEKESKN